MTEDNTEDPVDEVLSDEMLRERIRRSLRAEPPGRLQRLLSHDIVKILFGFLLTGVVGAFLTWRVEESTRRRDEALARYEAGVTAIQSFSRAVYARHTRAMMLASSLRRDVDLEEIKRRKLEYDQAFVDWGTEQQANLLAIRKLTQASRFSKFEADVEFELVPVLRDLDACLTEAYDTRLGGGEPQPVLDSCNISILLQQALDEGYAITNGLFEYVSQTTE